MGGIKNEYRFQLNDDHVQWLRDMARKHGLADESKALRVVLDYARQEADEESVFSQIRCLHCG